MLLNFSPRLCIFLSIVLVALCYLVILTSPFVFPLMFANSLFTLISSIPHPFYSCWNFAIVAFGAGHIICSMHNNDIYSLLFLRHICVGVPSVLPLACCACKLCFLHPSSLYSFNFAADTMYCLSIVTFVCAWPWHHVPTDLPSGKQSFLLSTFVIIGLPGLHFLVIPAPHIGAWLKVSDGVTAQFHSKFWGKSLEEEGQQSRDTSWFGVRGSGVQCEVFKVQDGVPGDMVDDGDNLDMDENDNITPGSHILDIGIGDIGKILIHMEYMCIYDHLEHQLATVEPLLIHTPYNT